MILLEFFDENVEFTPYLHLWKIGSVFKTYGNYKGWNIPENAEKPERTNKRKEEQITLLDILKEQKASNYSGGIYHKTQIDLTYNSNHMERSSLTHDQTRYTFETNSIGVEKEVLNVDDVIETANHFRCIDMIIDHAKAALTEKFIKELFCCLGRITIMCDTILYYFNPFFKSGFSSFGHDNASSCSRRF